MRDEGREGLCLEGNESASGEEEAAEDGLLEHGVEFFTMMDVCDSSDGRAV